jgi:tetratricopeptide (TPR) repeat protein
MSGDETLDPAGPCGLLRTCYQSRGPEFDRDPGKLLAQWDAGAGDLLRALELGAVGLAETVFVNEACWPVVKSPLAGPRRCGEALRLLEAACRSPGPQVGYAILNTLGVARYRVGRYAEALADLERSDALKKGEPVNWVFLAMAHHRLGHPDRAREFLAQSRTAVKDPKRANDRELRQFLAEAELLIEGLPRQLLPWVW